MDAQDRVELDRLMQRQSALQDELNRLNADLKLLADRFAVAPSEINPLEIAPLEIPPAVEPVQAAALPPHAQAVPPVIPTIPVAPPPPPPMTPPPIPLTELPPIPGQPERVIVQPDAAVAGEPSLEMKLGTYWLVRVGVVVLLTGLVFLGNYAYENFAGKFGAIGKLGILYLASALLVGFGAWLQRPRQQASLRNYGQVVFAGGLAAAYFTTYAAHHVTALQVIKSAVVDGLLLLAFAGLIFWFADRRKSQVLALFAIGLAYYTSVITNIGLFTLYSNLVLSATAVLFLLRNRWAAVSFASMAGTYVAYTFWRFHDVSGWLWGMGTSEFWIGVSFLTVYWVVFTAAVFLSKAERLSAPVRATFLTINNAGYFALIVLSMLPLYRHEFWKFAIAYGGVLLGCSAIARALWKDESGVRTAYLAQGLVILTVGVIAHFTGLKLALILAAQSVILFLLSGQQQSLTMKIGSFVAAVLAAHTAIRWQLHDGSALLGGSVGALLFVNAIWANRRESVEGYLLRPTTTFFSALAMAIWFVVTWKTAPLEWRSPILALEGVLFTVSFHVLRSREVSVVGQLFLLIAQLVCFGEFFGPHKLPWWNPGIVIAATIGVSHWWQLQKNSILELGGLQKLFQLFYGLAAVGVGYTLLKPLFGAESWLAVTALVAMGGLLYAIMTRAWFLAIASQLFLVLSVLEFVQQTSLSQPAWYFSMVPILVLLAIGFLVSAWIPRGADVTPGIRASLAQATVFYRWVAVAMSIAWVSEYITVDLRFLAYAALGSAIFLVASRRKSEEGMLASAAYLGVGFLFFFSRAIAGGTAQHWPNVLALVAPAILQQLTRRQPGWYPLKADTQNAMMILSAVGLWIEVSQWVVASSGGRHFLLTVTWGLLALVIFTAGLVLRERMYRWVGLVVLGCAVGRVFLSDVWKLQTVYRILSFIGLGIVLLVLGFLYNKFQQKIREWI